MPNDNTNKNVEQNNADAKQRITAQLKPIFVDGIKGAFPKDHEIISNIAVIYDLLAVKSFIPDADTCKLGIDFLNEATRDIKSCKILYSRKSYPHAVYHLQQAVEKSIKGYVLLEGYFKIKDVREITTHQSPLVLMKAVFEKTGVKKLAEISNDPTLKNKIEDAEATIEEKRIEIAKTPKEEINKLYSQRKEYRKAINLMTETFNNGLTRYGISPIPRSLFENISAMMTIMILAIITFPHESYSRYPDGKITPINYNRQFGIVCETLKIARLLEAELKNLRKGYEQKR